MVDDSGQVEEILFRGSGALGLSLTASQTSTILNWIQRLSLSKESMNLTGFSSPREMIIYGVLDAFLLLQFIPEYPLHLLDIGSGAGFPGVALKIARPDCQVYLIDSRKKSVAFLKSLSTILPSGIQVILGRSEEVARDSLQRERYDVVTMRGVAALATSLELALPFLKEGGIFLAPKGKKVWDEVEEGRAALEILGGRLVEVRKLMLPVVGEERAVVVTTKDRSAPGKFPRRPGIPQKRPLVSRETTTGSNSVHKEGKR